MTQSFQVVGIDHNQFQALFELTDEQLNLETAVDRSDCSEKPVFIDVAGFL